VILKQIPGATTILINKAITGWFKHAGDRYERRIQKYNHSVSADEDSPQLLKV